MDETENVMTVGLLPEWKDILPGHPGADINISYRAGTIPCVLRYDGGCSGSRPMHLLCQLGIPAAQSGDERKIPNGSRCLFRKPLAGLRLRGQGFHNGKVFDTYGIAYVRDPYGARNEP